MAGGQLANVFEEGLLVGQVFHAQPVGEPPLVQAPACVRMREKPLDLRAEQDAVAFHGVVERLDAEGVPGAEKLARGGVVQGEGEHAAQAVEHCLAPLLEPVEHHFRIALGREGVACGDQLPAQFPVVVDLAVEDEHERAILVVEGLVRPGEIDDGQTPETQGGPAVFEIPFRIGPAMGDGIGHGDDGGAVVVGLVVLVDKADKAAHKGSFLKARVAKRGKLAKLLTW